MLKQNVKTENTTSMAATNSGAHTGAVAPRSNTTMQNSVMAEARKLVA